MIVRTTVKSIQDIMRQDVGVDGDAQRISQLCWMFFLKIIDDQDQDLELAKDDYRSPIPQKYQWRNWAADPEGITGEELLTFVNDELFPALKNLSVSTKPGDRRRVVRDVFEDAYNYMKSGQLMRQVINRINEIDFNSLDERRHFGEFYEQLLNGLQSAGNAGEYYTPRAVTAFMADRIDPKPGETLLDPACGTGGFLTCAINHMRKRYVKRPEDEAKMQASLRAVEKKQLPHMLCVTNMLLHGIEDPSFVRHDNTLARPYISYTQSDRVDIVLTNPPRRARGGRHRAEFSGTLPHARDCRPVPCPHHPLAQAWRPRGNSAAGRHTVWRGRENAAERAPHGGVQPPHHRPPAQFRVSTLFLDRHQPPVFRERRTDQGHLVLGASRAGGPKSLFYDEADPLRASAKLYRLVGRGEAQRA
jgi:type I restriction enzyme M protein